MLVERVRKTAFVKTREQTEKRRKKRQMKGRSAMLARALLVLTTFLLAVAAAAHPGHGASDQAQSLLHYLTEPIHVIGVLAVAFVVISGAGFLRRRQTLQEGRQRR
jgi:type IV secretory pathway VirB2 component (pilin)